MPSENQQPNKKFLIVVAGPTAVGKTKVAIQIAKLFNCEIISADSRQFYAEMKIGNARPTESELHEVKHHFVNFISIHTTYNVSIFEQDVLQLLETLFKCNDFVVVCGGSGLFVNAIVHGMDEVPNANEEIRNQLNEVFKLKGISALQQQLKMLDPDYYAVADLNNPRRVQRALEVCLQTGKPYSSFLGKGKQQRNFVPILIGLHSPKEKLHEKINKRVDQMMQDGFLDEAKKLLPFKDLQVLKSVGYAEMFEHLEEKNSLDETVEKIKLRTRQLAKRQLTWFRRTDDYMWFEPENLKQILDFIKSKTN